MKSIFERFTIKVQYCLYADPKRREAYVYH
jgi:hypothetical protein